MVSTDTSKMAWFWRGQLVAHATFVWYTRTAYILDLERVILYDKPRFIRRYYFCCCQLPCRIDPIWLYHWDVSRG